MVLKCTVESLQKADFNICSSPQRTQGKTASTERKEERESQSASYRRILRELGPTDCGFGSVVPVALSPANQLCNSTLQCKLKFLIPTECQRGLFFFFLNPTVGHRSQVFSWLLFSCCQFRGQKKKKCVSDPYVLQVHARLNCFQNAGAWDLLRH